MPELVTSFLEQLEGWILAMSASGWVYPAMFGFATVDGFFPPLPSESVVITLSVSAWAKGVPWLPGVALAAMLGAWLGDQIAYAIGRIVGTDRTPFLRTARARRVVSWARQAMNHRGGAFILAARYIPVGRVAVNMTAGAVGYPRRRFMVYSAVAAFTWALYSIVIGVAAAAWLGHKPLLAMTVGIVVGVVLGFALDKMVQLVTRRRVVETADAGSNGATLSAAPAVAVTDES